MSDSHDAADRRTLQIPAHLHKACEELKRAYDLANRVCPALGKKLRTELNKKDANRAKGRVRLYALNEIGERLEWLLWLAERDNKRLQASVVRPLLEFLSLASLNTALEPDIEKRRFVQYSNPAMVVNTTGVKFIARGVKDLMDGTQLSKGNMERLRKIYASTSAHVHPSPEGYYCFARDSKGEHVITAPGIDAFAHLIASTLTWLCFKLSNEYDLGVVAIDDVLSQIDPDRHT